MHTKYDSTFTLPNGFFSGCNGSLILPSTGSPYRLEQKDYDLPNATLTGSARHESRLPRPNKSSSLLSGLYITSKVSRSTGCTVSSPRDAERVSDRSGLELAVRHWIGCLVGIRTMSRLLLFFPRCLGLRSKDGMRCIDFASCLPINFCFLLVALDLWFYLQYHNRNVARLFSASLLDLFWSLNKCLSTRSKPDLNPVVYPWQQPFLQESAETSSTPSVNVSGKQNR
jgi:hypothetical protein